MNADRPIRERLERLLHRERLAGRMDHRDRMALPIEERVERGDSLAGLAFAGEDGGRIRLRCADNQSKYRPGDALRLRNGDDAAGATSSISVVYEAYDESRAELIVSRDPFRREGRFDPSRPLQLDPEETSLVEMGLEALATLSRRKDPAAAVVRELIELRAEVRRNTEDQALAARVTASPHLDAAKREAAVPALATAGLREWSQARLRLVDVE